MASDNHILTCWVSKTACIKIFATGDLGPAEFDKLIVMLRAQREVLDDADKSPASQPKGDAG